MPQLYAATLSVRTRRSTWTAVHANDRDVIIRRKPDDRAARFYAYRYVASHAWRQIPGHFYRLDQAQAALASETACVIVWEPLIVLLDLALVSPLTIDRPIAAVADGTR